MAIIESLSYYPATIVDIISETPRAKTFRLSTSSPVIFAAGQHTIVRVTLEGVFRTSRHYSFSSAPSSGFIDITIAKSPGGAVSSWFCDAAKIGDKVEITRPLGDGLVRVDFEKPLLLIAGGIGITPLMSMLREHRLRNATSSIRILYSTRDYKDICFRNELVGSSRVNEQVVFTLVDSIPGDWQGQSGIIDTSMIEPLLLPEQRAYICGPYGFVAHAHDILIDMGVQASHIHKENFTLS